MTNFRIIKKDTKTLARLGVLKTPHGIIHTPSYVIVATHAKIKSLKPSDIKKTKTQVVIANAYHLWGKANVHKLLGVKMPIMTDSGGFQVFSLGFGRENHVGKILTTSHVVSPQVMHRRRNIKITNKGVYFLLDGKKRFLGPELSIKIQEKLRADMIFAFDECTSPLDSYSYNKKAMERTHRWALKCLEARDKSRKQMLFGIVQGGKFKSLRVKSAKFIGSLPFEGIGIGGSFGKEEMVKTLKWIIPHLPKEKPRHLLGIGRIQDVFNAVENGVDTFDCVIPTREARHGRLYTKTGHMDIRKGKYLKDKKIIEKGCLCPTCRGKIPRSKIRELLKSEDLKNNAAGQRWCLMHNMWFFNNLLEEIRKSIKNNKFRSFKNSFLSRFNS